MRSIRRSSEVVASFRYHSISGRSESTSSSIISSTFNSVNYSLWSGKTSTSSSNTSVELAQTASNSHEETVVLRIAAFGVTLRSGQALIARDFGEYKNVMDAAFVSMTHPAVGDVVSVEIMPWVANINFQVALTLDNPIRTGPDDNTPAFMRRFNLIVNAEHVARMDDIVQKRTQMIGKVSKCIRRLNFYPRDFNSRKLKSNAECTPGETCDSSMTIGILKAALVAVDDNDTYLVDRMARRLNEYVRNYFAPCMSDMAEVVSGVSAGGMQTKHWSDMTHCQEMSCVFPSVDWVAASRTCRATTVETGTTLVESYCYPVLQ
mmetsp:Transcript_25549/g.58939  ORF Transcript_25549/g.58939 Transcript_25549/m.58939 type:complete len:320 (+) Transcript_25549:542-1501(+)